MFSIGEFSKVAGLSVKTLRFYHEQGLLAPARVDPETGYRYYDAPQVEKAHIIRQLRHMDFSLEEIGQILHGGDEEADLLTFLERQKATLEGRLRRYRAVVASLDTLIRQEKEARAAMKNASFDVQEKSLDGLLVAGVRMTGRYCDCGRGFSRIGKQFGRHIAGRAFLLHYDCEYKEEDADFEACFPVRQGKAVDGISVRELEGGRCVSLLHQGPYAELGRSYAKLLEYVQAKGYEVVLPTREVYVKGPGMVFKGNPKKYLTEIQMLVRDRQAP